MPRKFAVMVYLGDYYGEFTNYPSLQFAYRNVSEFANELSSRGWVVYPPISDQLATKEYCIEYLHEKIELLQEDDWFLFYYVGHADRYNSTDAFDDHPVHMVTSLDNGGNLDDPFSFFMDTQYENIIHKFRATAPNGHMITVLDCCYAFGLVNDHDKQSEFHSVFAASNGKAKAAYSDNSFFFKSFSKSWKLNSFEKIQSAVESSMMYDYNGFTYRNFCKIHLASNFRHETL